MGADVTTFAVVWIEMLIMLCRSCLHLVTTFAVVWIEMYQCPRLTLQRRRHHLRVVGVKY